MVITFKGKELLLDEEDLRLVIGKKWILTNGRVLVNQLGSGFTCIHRVILGLPGGKHGGEVDHINGNPLDNRRCNLRICSRSENARNRGPNPIGTRKRKHPYKGIIFHSNGANLKKPWFARCGIRPGKYVASKYFATPIEAARAYDILALKHHGEYARLNFPKEKK